MSSPSTPAEPPAGATAAAVGESSTSRAGVTTAKPCANCRRRKVRCDKNDPCANCVRSGARCIYEGTTRNEDGALLRDAATTSELCDRLSRLECLMESMAAMSFRDVSAAQRVGVAMDPSNSGLLTAPRSETNEPAKLLGRAIFDARSSVYLDSSAWSDLFERVEGLKYWLSYQPSLLLPTAAISNPFIFSFGPDAPPPEVEFYPSIQQSDLICKIFFRIVEPFIKVLHRSRFAKDLEQYRRQALTEQVEFEALLFAIHALTVAVLPLDIVQQTFGEHKDDMLERFQREVEKALARADILKSRSETCLQAYLYYLTFLFEVGRYDEASSLLGLALRLAQRLGLQYEPSNFSFSQWQAEMRRRTWNYLVHLDFRALTLSAIESAISEPFDREPQVPRNLDDNEWEPCQFARKSSQVTAANGFRETTFCIIRRRFSMLFRKVTQTDISFENAQELIRQARDDVQQRYLEHFSTGHPLHELVAALVRQQFSFLDIVSRHMYMKHQKRSVRSGSATSIYPTSAPKPNTFRHNLFLACVAHLEETSRLEAFYSRYKWQWIIRDPVPWHAIARILTDLCHWFEGPEVERARKEIGLVWARYGEESGSLINSPIFQPLRSMREQAHFALQKFRGGGGGRYDDEEADRQHLNSQMLPPDLLSQTASYSPEYDMQNLGIAMHDDFFRIHSAIPTSSTPGVERGAYFELPFEHVARDVGSGYWSGDQGGGSSNHST